MWVHGSKGGMHIHVCVHWLCLCVCACVSVCVHVYVGICCCFTNLFISKFGYLSILLLVHLIWMPQSDFWCCLLHALQLGIWKHFIAFFLVLSIMLEERLPIQHHLLDSPDSSVLEILWSIWTFRFSLQDWHSFLAHCHFLSSMDNEDFLLNLPGI